MRELFKKLTDMGVQCVYCNREIPSDRRLCERCANLEHSLIPSDCMSGEVLHVFPYEGIVRKLMHHLKYNDAPQLAEYIAEKMCHCYVQSQLSVDIVTFAPVHKNRLKQRGFDQSELIATHLGAFLGLPVASLLVRTKDTKPQFNLGREDRLQNMEDAFSLRNDMDITGKTILLIDDIYTTGATLQACAKCLAPAALVVPFVFCRD